MENCVKEMLVTLADAGVEFVVGDGVACVLQMLNALLSTLTSRCN